VIEGSNLKPKIQWLKALTLSQPVRSNFQIINRIHNAHFLKKIIFGEKMIILEKIKTLQINPNSPK